MMYFSDTETISWGTMEDWAGTENCIVDAYCEWNHRPYEQNDTGQFIEVYYKSHPKRDCPINWIFVQDDTSYMAELEGEKVEEENFPNMQVVTITWDWESDAPPEMDIRDTHIASVVVVLEQCLDILKSLFIPPRIIVDGETYFDPTEVYDPEDEDEY